MPWQKKLENCVCMTQMMPLLCLYPTKFSPTFVLQKGIYISLVLSLICLYEVLKIFLRNKHINGCKTRSLYPSCLLQKDKLTENQIPTYRAKPEAGPTINSSLCHVVQSWKMPKSSKGQNFHQNLSEFTKILIRSSTS